MRQQFNSTTNLTFTQGIITPCSENFLRWLAKDMDVVLHLMVLSFTDPDQALDPIGVLQGLLHELARLKKLPGLIAPAFRDRFIIVIDEAVAFIRLMLAFKLQMDQYVAYVDGTISDMDQKAIQSARPTYVDGLKPWQQFLCNRSPGVIDAANPGDKMLFTLTNVGRKILSMHENEFSELLFYFNDVSDCP